MLKIDIYLKDFFFNMAKKNTKTKKEIDLNDVDSIIKDMKDLAFNEPKEETKVSKKKENREKVSKTIDVVSEKDGAQLVIEKEKKVDVSKKNETTISEISVSKEQNETEDLSFVDEIKENEEILKAKANIEENKNIENKPKKKVTYEEMFGATWCGYGFTNN